MVSYQTAARGASKSGTGAAPPPNEREEYTTILTKARASSIQEKPQKTTTGYLS